MPRWVSIGPVGDDYAEKSESILRHMGPYAVRRRAGRIEFALRFATVQDESLLQYSKWIGSQDSPDVVDVQAILESPGISDIDRWQADLSDLPRTAEVLDQFDGIKRFERLNRVMFHTGVRQLPIVIQDLIAPKFFGWYPGGRILFSTASRSLHEAMASIRVMGAAMDLADRSYEELEKIGPFRMLSKIQSTGVFYVGKHLSIPLGFFLPRLYGFVGSKVTMALLFLLDKPISDIREVYPRSGLEFFRSEASGLFRQSLDIDVHEITPDAIDKFTLITHEHTADEIRRFMQNYLLVLNSFLFFMIDPSNFAHPDTGMWSGLAQYQAWLTFERISTELILLMTDDTSSLRKMALFRILDQLSALAASNPSDQVEFFRNLVLPIDAGSDLISDSLDPYEGEVGASMRDALISCRDELVRTVLDSIYVPGRHNIELKTVELAGGSTVTEIEYVRNTIREIRNTHHGYYTHRFDEYLSINTGNTPDSLSVIGILAYLAFLSKPHLFISRDWG